MKACVLQASYPDRIGGSLYITDLCVVIKSKWKKINLIAISKILTSTSIWDDGISAYLQYFHIVQDKVRGSVFRNQIFVNYFWKLDVLVLKTVVPKHFSLPHIFEYNYS